MPPKKIPKKYTAGLVGKEKQEQIKSIREGKPRPKTSAKSKQSPATTAFKKNMEILQNYLILHEQLEYR